eukprot:4328628-Prymnesium_polylepis.2
MVFPRFHLEFAILESCILSFHYPPFVFCSPALSLDSVLPLGTRTPLGIFSTAVRFTCKDVLQPAVFHLLTPPRGRPLETGVWNPTLCSSLRVPALETGFWSL